MGIDTTIPQIISSTKKKIKQKPRKEMYMRNDGTCVAIIKLLQKYNGVVRKDGISDMIGRQKETVRKELKRLRGCGYVNERKIMGSAIILLAKTEISVDGVRITNDKKLRKLSTMNTIQGLFENTLDGYYISMAKIKEKTSEKAISSSRMSGLYITSMGGKIYSVYETIQTFYLRNAVEKMTILYVRSNFSALEIPAQFLKASTAEYNNNYIDGTIVIGTNYDDIKKILEPKKQMLISPSMSTERMYFFTTTSKVEMWILDIVSDIESLYIKIALGKQADKKKFVFDGKLDDREALVLFALDIKKIDMALAMLKTSIIEKFVIYCFDTAKDTLAEIFEKYDVEIKAFTHDLVLKALRLEKEYEKFKMKKIST